MLKLSRAIDKTLRTTSPTKTIKLADNIEFLNKFKEFGKIGYIDGLIALQAIEYGRTKKSHPILLNDFDKNNREFIEFLKIIKINRYLLSTREFIFISSGIHWIPGYIRVSDDGQVSILITDSLSVTKREINDISFLSYLRRMLSDINTVFNNDVAVYIADTKRQNSPRGCSVFSIDDAMHLANIDDNLPRTYQYKGGIFDYIKENASAYFVNTDTKGIATQTKKSDKSFKFHLVKLPLYLMRTLQSSRLTSDTFLKSYSYEEQTSPFTKKKLAPKSSIEAHFDEHGTNMRLSYKLERIRNKTHIYLESHTLNEIKREIVKSSLHGFKTEVKAVQSDIKSIEKGLFNIYLNMTSKIRYNQTYKKLGHDRLLVEFTVRKYDTQQQSIESDDKLSKFYTL